MEPRSFAERLRPWIPALFWIAVIAWESTGLFTSENTFWWLYSVVSFAFGAVDREKLALANGVLRKGGHFAGYALLSYLFFVGWRGRFFSKRNLSRRQLRAAGHALAHVWRGRWAWYAVLMTVAVASLDEFHQTFLPGRTGTWRDVVLDGIGAICAQLVVLVANPGAREPVEVPEEEKVVKVTGDR